MKNKRKKIRIIYTLFGTSLILGTMIAALFIIVILPAKRYKEAADIQLKGQFEQAREIFLKLGNYKDSSKRAKDCEDSLKEEAYDRAYTLMAEKKYDEAIKAFEALGNYYDSYELIEDCKKYKKYDEAMLLKQNKQFEEAIKIFEELGYFLDSTHQIYECEQAISRRD